MFSRLITSSLSLILLFGVVAYSSDVVGDVCLLPPDREPCKGGRRHGWYFEGGECRSAAMLGCRWDENNFRSRRGCERTCARHLLLRSAATVDSGSRCALPVDVGPCKMARERWHYDGTDGACHPFTYGGCRGNSNNFLSRRDCEKGCLLNQEEAGAGGSSSSSSRCSLPMAVGPCRQARPRWYHDKASGTCLSFLYGGCRGNENNFATKGDCKRTCIAAGHPSPEEALGRARDEAAPVVEEEAGVVDDDDDDRVVFPDHRVLAWVSGSTVEIPAACLLPARIPGNRRSRCTFLRRETRFTYVAHTGICQSVKLRDCESTDNAFASEQACLDYCSPATPPPKQQEEVGPAEARCSLPMVSGRCLAYIESYGYDSTSGTCKKFIYGGDEELVS